MSEILLNELVLMENIDEPDGGITIRLSITERGQELLTRKGQKEILAMTVKAFETYKESMTTFSNDEGESDSLTKKGNFEMLKKKEDEDE